MNRSEQEADFRHAGEPSLELEAPTSTSGMPRNPRLGAERTAAVVQERVIAIIAQVMQVEPETIGRDSTFEDLGMDSIDGIEAICLLEDEFGVRIPDDQARSVRSVREIIEAVDAHRGGGGAAAEG